MANKDTNCKRKEKEKKLDMWHSTNLTVEFRMKVSSLTEKEKKALWEFKI